MLDDLEFKNNRDYFFGIQKKEDICISQVGRSKDISLVFWWAYFRRGLCSITRFWTYTICKS